MMERFTDRVWCLGYRWTLCRTDGHRWNVNVKGRSYCVNCGKRQKKKLST